MTPKGDWMPKPDSEVEAPKYDRAGMAAMCLQGLLANANPQILTMTKKSFAEMSIRQADALIAELEKPKP
jgi:hypothetical protein